MTEAELRTHQAWQRLGQSLARGASELTCLRRWSAFVRARDECRCVLCRSEDRVSAHHVCRKSLMPAARFLTGNGITLCRGCHLEAHGGFNRRPDVTQPMDAEGGEKIELLAEIYASLADERDRRDAPDRFFHISEPVLRAFKAAQGFDPFHVFAGPTIRQAANIWRGAPASMIAALIRANLP